MSPWDKIRFNSVYPNTGSRYTVLFDSRAAGEIRSMASDTLANLQDEIREFEKQFPEQEQVNMNVYFVHIRLLGPRGLGWLFSTRARVVVNGASDEADAIVEARIAMQERGHTRMKVDMVQEVEHGRLAYVIHS